MRLDLPADRIGIIALVAVQDITSGKLFEQFCTCRAIGDLAASEHEGEWPAIRIGQGVDFGGAAAARTSDGLVFPPLCRR